MRVGVLTFSEADNYGAMLQAYALQKYLLTQGHDSELIRYRNNKIWNSYHYASIKTRGSLKNYIKKILELLLFRKRTNAFKKFREKLNLTEVVYGEKISDFERRYDKIIVGSDQVWNPRNSGGDVHFLLDFVQNDRKKIAYAVSLGNPDYFFEFGINAMEYVKRIPYISSREELGKTFLEEHTKRKVDCVCDPVFLLRKEQWYEIVGFKPNIDYILVYSLDPNRELVQYVNRVSLEENLIVFFVPGIINTIIPALKIKKIKILYGIGPEDMISLISGAKYVVSDSFHGTALSIIMEKEFVTFISNSKSNTNSRIENLLELLGLDDRKMISLNDGIRITNSIDYKVVSNELEKYRTRSTEFLNTSICNL